MWISGRLFPAGAFCHKVHIDAAALYVWVKPEMENSMMLRCHGTPQFSSRDLPVQEKRASHSQVGYDVMWDNH